MRVQRFTPGDVVRDLQGDVVTVLEAFQDPHPPEFSHCGGVSARYTVRTLNCQNDVRWDWQLLHTNPCNTFSASAASLKTEPTPKASSAPLR